MTKKTKKHFIATALAVLMALFTAGGSMATDTCVGENCGKIALPCVNCSTITPYGPDEMSKTLNVKAGGELNIDQVQSYVTNVTDCNSKVDVDTAQKITGIVQLPITDVNATGAVNVTASQLNIVPSTTETVGNNTVIYLAQSFEKVVASATANYIAPEAKIETEQADTVEIKHQGFDNGMKSSLNAATCFIAGMYGDILTVASQQMNSFGFSASNSRGSWESIMGQIQLNTGIMPTASN